MQTKSLKAELTIDMRVVNQILSHPSIHPHITDDFTVGKEAAYSENHLWVLISDEDEVHGVFLVYPHNTILYEVHTSLLPSIWGRRASEAVQVGYKWLFDNTPCLKLITSVPECNKIALRFAKSQGMVWEGTNTKSIMKNGQLMDQHILGITKEEYLCQH